jgi:uncharacterized membrane protein YhaH (DUF805 family)
MNFFQSIQTCFKKYFDFSGRASRSEYWYFILFYWLTDYLFQYVTFKLAGGMEGFSAFFFFDSTENPAYLICTLLIAIPAISVSWRRLHDVNRSAWWVLIMFTGVGILFPLLYWNCKKGDENENRFGDNPLHDVKV